MKRITDEYIAKLAGWTQKPKGYWREPGWSEKMDGLCGARNVPAFTTSLDAVVGLTEGEGLYWTVGGGKKCHHYLAWVQEYGADKPLYWGTQPTAPQALCAAYAGYKKRAKP